MAGDLESYRVVIESLADEYDVLDIAEEDVRRSHQAGFIEHLTKPVDFDRLRSTIDRVMQGSEDIVMSHSS